MPHLCSWHKTPRPRHCTLNAIIQSASSSTWVYCESGCHAWQAHNRSQKLKLPTRYRSGGSSCQKNLAHLIRPLHQPLRNRRFQRKKGGHRHTWPLRNREIYPARCQIPSCALQRHRAPQKATPSPSSSGFSRLFWHTSSGARKQAHQYHVLSGSASLIHSLIQNRFILYIRQDKKAINRQVLTYCVTEPQVQSRSLRGCLRSRLCIPCHKRIEPAGGGRNALLRDTRGTAKRMDMVKYAP